MLASLVGVYLCIAEGSLYEHACTHARTAAIGPVAPHAPEACPAPDSAPHAAASSSASPAAGSAAASAPAAAPASVPTAYAYPFQPLQQHPTMPQPSLSMPKPPISIVGGTIIGGAPSQQHTNKRRHGERGVDATKRRKRRCGTCLENNYCGCSKKKQKTCDCEYPCKGSNRGRGHPCEYY